MRTSFGPPGPHRTFETTSAVAESTAADALADAPHGQPAPECSTCAGRLCLDCVQGVAHDECTRRCPDCAADDVDWEQAWETTRIITELGGLDRLDEAIRTETCTGPPAGGE